MKWKSRQFTLRFADIIQDQIKYYPNSTDGHQLRQHKQCFPQSRLAWTRSPPRLSSSTFPTTSRLLHLVVTDSLLVTRRYLLAIGTLDSRATWQRLTRGGGWLHEPVALGWKLGVRGTLVVLADCAVARTAAHRLGSRLGVDVVVGDMALLGVVLGERDVRRVGRDSDDVPRVEEAGEEAEAC